MSNTITQTKEQLQAEKRELLAKLSGANHDEISQLLRENEAAIKELNKVELLRQVNGKYSRLREMALLAYECEQPTEDITTNDSSFHKVKAKKYPKIAALQYASAKWKDNRLMELRINGERFYMFRAKYEYNKDTVYTRPETFADFLSLNSIPETEITIEQYNEMATKLAAFNEKLQKDIEAYKRGLESINYSSVAYWGLLEQHNTNLYEYLPTVR